MNKYKSLEKYRLIREQDEELYNTHIKIWNDKQHKKLKLHRQIACLMNCKKCGDYTSNCCEICCKCVDNDCIFLHSC